MTRLKQQPGKDILLFGSSALMNMLNGHDLIDEYRLMAFPMVLGKGKRLFGEGMDTKILQLVGTETFGRRPHLPAGERVVDHRRRVMSNQSNNHGLSVIFIGLGVLLMVLGGLFLMVQAVGFDLGPLAWPFFVIVPGLAVFGAGLAIGDPTGERRVRRQASTSRQVSRALGRTIAPPFRMPTIRFYGRR